jgi:hypothetical protein
VVETIEVPNGLQARVLNGVLRVAFVVQYPDCRRYQARMAVHDDGVELCPVRRGSVLGFHRNTHACGYDGASERLHR